MPTPFRQTLLALDADVRSRHRIVLGIATAVVLGAVWMTWFFSSRVPIYAQTDEARIEVREGVHRVDVTLDGRVVEVLMQPGQLVEEGAPLLVLDSTDVDLRIKAIEEQLAGVQAEMAELQGELQARAESIAEAEVAGRADVSEAAAQRRKSEVAAELASAEAKRVRQLREQGVAARAEWEQARAERYSKRSEVEAAKQRLLALGSEAKRDLADRRAHLAGLERQAASLQANEKNLQQTLARLRTERSLHTVRAPVSGRLGQVEAPQYGAVVRRGETLAVVVPVGDFQIVAKFVPSDAVGRIEVGQRARMRLEGFPWTHYGVLQGHVTQVSSEPLDGFIEVDLALDQAPTTIPVQHGLLGEVEITLEEISPARLLLRSVGRVITG